MKVYFYTFNLSRTGEYLYNRLGSILLQRLDDIDLDSISRDDILIRWGRADNEFLDKKFNTVYNTAQSLRNVHNKAGFLLAMRNAGIRCPRVFLHPDDIDRFPVIARRYNYHSHGNWAIKIGSRRGIRRAGRRHHYVEFIRGNIELRVHVIGNKVVRISRKIPNEYFEGRMSKIIRSHKRGWVYVDDFDWITRNESLISEVKTQCLNAIKLSSLTFGAVDCIIRNYNNLPYILEINSAPALNKYGRRLYEVEFRKLFNKPQRRWFRGEGLRIL